MYKTINDYNHIVEQNELNNQIGQSEYEQIINPEQHSINNDNPINDQNSLVYENDLLMHQIKEGFRRARAHTRPRTSFG